MFETLQIPETDPLVLVNRLCRGDPRSDKLDLGVGVYRDADGLTPVQPIVKEAEQLLWRSQESKAYLGPDGDPLFADLLTGVVLGTDHAAVRAGRVVGFQAPGGTGAFRLGLDLLSASARQRKVWVGLPTWPNHMPMIQAAGLAVATYVYYDVPTAALRIDTMLDALERAEPGDIVLLHGCCHNPTGADLSLSDWHVLADLMQRRGLIPFVDLAYQGLGHGLDADAAGVRHLIAQVPEALIAVSCSKNFGLYRDRTGMLVAVAQNAAGCDGVREILHARARLNYSTPPDHGASVVRIILGDDRMRRQWRSGVEAMRARIAEMREALATALADAGHAAAHIRQQNGLFVMLPVPLDAIRRLRSVHGIYMAETGRLSVAGLQSTTVERFARSLVAEMRAAQTGVPA